MVVKGARYLLIALALILLYPQALDEPKGFWHSAVVIKNQARGDSSEMEVRWYERR